MIGAVLPTQLIRRRCLEFGMVSPFSERTEYNGTSYGIGPAGYDLRIDRDIVLWPSRSVRADAIEYIKMPPDLIGLMFSKSTWARIHIEHAGTTIDPGFEGNLRLEINMHEGNDIVEIKRGTGIVHVIFLLLVEPTEAPYQSGDKYFCQGPDTDAIYRG